MAQSFATLDILSGGNLIVGVGEGSTKLDFDALGLPFDQRRKMLDDGVTALRTLLGEAKASHHGDYYSFENVRISPKSVQQPTPPIWLSGWGGPRGMRRVARLGDGWVASALHSSPQEFQEAKAILDSALVEVGKDPAGFPHAVDTMFMYVDADGDRARRESAPIIEKSSGMPFDPESGHYLVGSYQECKGLLARWIGAGARRICLWPVKDPIEQMKRFGQHVAPGL